MRLDIPVTTFPKCPKPFVQPNVAGMYAHPDSAAYKRWYNTPNPQPTPNNVTWYTAPFCCHIPMTSHVEPYTPAAYHYFACNECGRVYL